MQTVEIGLYRAARLAAAIIICLFGLNSLRAAAPFIEGNLLVTHGNTLYEYRLDRTLVQSIAVPHPDTSRYEVYDAVYDRFGRAHVVNYGPFSNSYISTYDPAAASWTHTAAPLAIGNVSDGDLSIIGDKLFARGIRMDAVTRAVETFDIGMFNGPSETSVGHDGILYSINSGSPRYRVQRTDPVSLANEGSEFDVRDSAGTRLDGRGLAVTAASHLFVADWNGRIYQHDATGAYVGDFPTNISNLLDINLRADGRLATGGRFGQVALTSVGFESPTILTVGTGLTYTAFVTPPIPEPSAIVLAALGAIALAMTNARRASRH